MKKKEVSEIRNKQDKEGKAKNEAREITKDLLEDVAGGLKRHRDDITTPEI